MRPLSATQWADACLGCQAPHSMLRDQRIQSQHMQPMSPRAPVGGRQPCTRGTTAPPGSAAARPHVPRPAARAGSPRRAAPRHPAPCGSRCAARWGPPGAGSSAPGGGPARRPRRHRPRRGRQAGDAQDACMDGDARVWTSFADMDGKWTRGYGPDPTAVRRATEGQANALGAAGARRRRARLVEQVRALGREAAGELVHLVRDARRAGQQGQAGLVLGHAAALQAGHLEQNPGAQPAPPRQDARPAAQSRP